ncbi:MAG: adenylosuccinate synthase [Planctomycetes bacterium]|nr:adenylosuccinate synthase [Planctomycetota bacterium]
MNKCVVGLQWGDEGKGKIVDLLSESVDIVVRYSGGANAGHSVVRDHDEGVIALHLIPSGILRDGVLCVITNGVVLDAQLFLDEIAGLKKRGFRIDDNLRLSGNAHLVMDYHKIEDRLSEESLGDSKIGTTIRGIGPCYSDKVSRTRAVRVADLMDLDPLEERLRKIVEYKNIMLGSLYKNHEPIRFETVFEDCQAWAEALQPYIIDTTALLHNAWRSGKSILFEGAQGTLLDLDHGTFPYVTSSNSSAVGLSAATGIPARAVDRFLGVAKAYTSRVGSGPFPTEQNNETGDYIREKGHEYGTTTGRPRRCGWFDAVSVAYSIQIGGIDEIAMMHLDTLSGLKELKVCVGYRYRGETLDFFPSEANVLSEVQCEYETLDGFDDDLTRISSFEDLPDKAKRYVLRLEEILNCPITMVGVGPAREQTLYHEG